MKMISAIAVSCLLLGFHRVRAESEPMIVLEYFGVVQDDSSVPSTQENHACYPSGEICDQPYYYYNWLACECLPRVDPPNEGTELTTSDLYPQWATESEISESISDGIRRAEGRPWDLNVCEVQGKFASTCRKDQYWDDLACTCYAYEEESCKSSSCAQGFVPDPRQGCDGQCIRIPDLIKELYPKWATPDDISLAQMNGKSDHLQNRFKVCPFKYDSEDPCEDGLQYWNELACQCLVEQVCLMICPGDDQDFHPLKQCACDSKENIKKDVYPDWATPLDIENAEREGLYRQQNQRWTCNPTPMCAQGTYLNELSCDCWPLLDLSCDLACEGEYDPRYECSCMSTEDFKGLFPAWATRQDIKDSMAGQWPTIPVERPVKLKVPTHWPTCEPIDAKCDRQDLNLLACECFTRVNCRNYCFDGIHDPVNGCDCISMEQYREYFPSWATQKDIDISEMLFYQNFDPMPMPEPFGPEDEEEDHLDRTRKDFLDGLNELFGLDQSSYLEAGRTGALLISTFLVLSLD